MPEFEPKIVGFLCNWCGYAGADLAGTSRLSYPTNIRIIRLMCSGRVEPAFILNAFEMEPTAFSWQVAILETAITGQVTITLKRELKRQRSSLTCLA